MTRGKRRFVTVGVAKTAVATSIVLTHLATAGD